MKSAELTADWSVFSEHSDMLFNAKCAQWDYFYSMVSGWMWNEGLAALK